jgi:hypothetical protein
MRYSAQKWAEFRKYDFFFCELSGSDQRELVAVIANVTLSADNASVDAYTMPMASLAA